MESEDLKHQAKLFKEFASSIATWSNTLDRAIAYNEELEKRLIIAVSEKAMNWWDKNLPAKLEDLKKWLGEPSDANRVYCRKLIANEKYETILDVGCGLGIEYDGFKLDGYSIEYYGVEVSSYLKDYCRTKGICIINGAAEDLNNFSDNKVDIVYIREVLEHLPDYKKALSEAIRVAKKEVMVVWFIAPVYGESKDNIKLGNCDGAEIFHNVYSMQKLQEFLSTFNVNYSFKPLDEKRVLLRIFKKKDILPEAVLPELPPDNIPVQDVTDLDIQEKKDE